MLRSALTLALLSPMLVGAGGTAVAASDPVHSLVVVGAGVNSYPAFDPDVDRYAVRGADGGTVRVRAETSDPDGRVVVNGVPQGSAADVPVPAEAGEEISVIFDDAGGRREHSLVVTPDGFPELAATTAPGADLTPGHVLLTLSDFSGNPGSLTYETAVDRQGVPIHVHAESQSSIDLKRQPDGSLTTQRLSAGAPGSGAAPLVVLDQQWQPTGTTHSTVGLANTDPHDSILFPDGRVVLMAYEPARDGLVDSVVQEIGPDGELLFEWSSREHLEETTAPGNPDYAHVNSVVVMEDGHWLLSFRHFSAVYKVARYDDGEHAAGDVIWKLGGRASTFDFVDDPHGGPCAQHTASELPNGNVLVFDNGGGEFFGTPSLCVAPDDRATGIAERPFTRITEYALDEEAGTATLFTYRAHLTEVPDRIDPEVTFALPSEVVQGTQVRGGWSCTDRGGANLSDCVVEGATDGLLDTATAGEHTLRVTAVDGAGNTTTREAAYVVVPRVDRVDAMLRAKGPWAGKGSWAAPKKQQVTVKLRRGARATVRVRVVNRGNTAATFRLTGAAPAKAFAVAYRHRGEKITGKVTRAGWRTPELAPGERATLEVRVERRPAAKPGKVSKLRIDLRSDYAPAASDRVRLRLRAR